MAEADAASERALKVARTIKDQIKPVARSSAPYDLDDLTLGKRSSPIRVR